MFWCRRVEGTWYVSFLQGFNRLLQVPFQSAEIEALFHGHLSACLVCYMNEVSILFSQFPVQILGNVDLNLG